jgi:hypothetical protein
VKEGPPPAAPPPCPAAPPPVVAPPPPRPAANGKRLPTFRELQEARDPKAIVLPFQPVVESAQAADLPEDVIEVPKAAKKPRKRRKGGA